MQKIFKYIIFSILLTFCVLNIQAQNKKPLQKTDTIHTPLFNGLRAEIDIAPIVSNFLGNGETFSYEGALQADILHKYYPVIELGFAGADRTAYSNVNFKTNGIFARAGLDFNIIKPKPNSSAKNNLFLGGARLGFSSFKYDLSNVIITDSYWKETKIINYTNEPASKLWFEIVAQLRVEIFKNIYMGWTVRNKIMLNQADTGEMNPWYVPGFGKNIGSSLWTINYAIGYKF